MKCSVVILNWNGAEMLQRYLPSVVEHTRMADTEVVVADNGSTDESLNLLAKDFGNVRIIPFANNIGFAAGYNQAIETLDSEYVVLLNSDVEVTEGWLEPMLRYMDAHEDVAAVQPKILSWSDKTRFEHAGAAGGFLDRYGYPYCRGRVLSKTETDHGQYDEPTEVLWTSGACMCVRTRIYKETGGLDDRYFAHMEEIDLCWRMASRGWKLMCLPCSTVYHLGGGALHYEHPKKTYLNFRNSLLTAYKNMPAGRLCETMVVRWLMDYAAALSMLLAGKAKNAAAIWKARRDYHKMRPSYKAQRTENIRLANSNRPKGWTNKLMLIEWMKAK